MAALALIRALPRCQVILLPAPHPGTSCVEMPAVWKILVRAGTLDADPAVLVGVCGVKRMLVLVILTEAYAAKRASEVIISLALIAKHFERQQQPCVSCRYIHVYVFGTSKKGPAREVQLSYLL